MGLELSNKAEGGDEGILLPHLHLKWCTVCCLYYSVCQNCDVLIRSWVTCDACVIQKPERKKKKISVYSFLTNEEEKPEISVFL
jgi:hypothetical protein